MIPFRLPKIPSLLLVIGVGVASATADDRWAPNAEGRPVDQLALSGNACGPAALLASARCGNDKWQALLARIPGRSDKSRLLYLIRAHGLKPSSSLRDRQRWTRDGINAEDLTAIAAELAAIGGIPQPKTEGLFAGRRESPEKLLRRAHDRLRDSLAKGMPPVLSLTRHVSRAGRWQPLQNHFVTVIRVPDKLTRDATSFTFTYLDPWGGQRREGTLRIPEERILATGEGPSPCLEAEVPGARIGKDKLRAAEIHAVVPAQVIGRW